MNLSLQNKQNGSYLLEISSIPRKYIGKPLTIKVRLKVINKPVYHESTGDLYKTVIIPTSEIWTEQLPTEILNGLYSYSGPSCRFTPEIAITQPDFLGYDKDVQKSEFPDLFPMLEISENTYHEPIDHFQKPFTVPLFLIILPLVIFFGMLALMIFGGFYLTEHPQLLTPLLEQQKTNLEWLQNVTKSAPTGLIAIILVFLASLPILIPIILGFYLYSKYYHKSKSAIEVNYPFQGDKLVIGQQYDINNFITARFQENVSNVTIKILLCNIEYSSEPQEKGETLYKQPVNPIILYERNYPVIHKGNTLRADSFLLNNIEGLLPPCYVAESMLGLDICLKVVLTSSSHAIHTWEIEHLIVE